ncbi:host cell RNA polymerase inhibitor [Pseudomonas sp. B14(2017)]|uniref:host cell RNA polymerase inhibitor n=1 Tax=Pseudomonas sp. B14(2017) TaxID=1981745 RepID=UPI00117BB19A|nr:host cell RNA polymerase inhibitor [Pseudomonas sp. B14(2017)]
MPEATEKRLFKVTVIHLGLVEEVPVWALDLGDAHAKAEAEYGTVLRVRPQVTP